MPRKTLPPNLAVNRTCAKSCAGLLLPLDLVKTRTLLILALCTNLIGCIPYVHEYYQMSMPGGKDKTSQRCGGPPDQVYFPYEGIYIAVGIERSMLNPSFGIDVYVPAERVAQLKSDLAETNC